MRAPGSGGVYPLDLALGLTRDGFSMFVISLAARLATYLTFDQVTGFLFAFLSWSPSKMTVEKAVLGLGHYTEAWFAHEAAPEGDGETPLLRHSLATEMLRNGATLDEIGEVLRHRLPDTTAIYAKVDLAALRGLAGLWPGGEA